MKEKELESQSAGYYAYAAAMDARMRAIKQWSHYTEDQKIEAERVKLGLELVYSFKRIFVNPRDKFITVKVENARVKDRKNLALLEKEYEARGYIKASSPQGVIYRIPKR